MLLAFQAPVQHHVSSVLHELHDAKLPTPMTSSQAGKQAGLLDKYALSGHA